MMHHKGALIYYFFRCQMAPLYNLCFIIYSMNVGVGWCDGYLSVIVTLVEFDLIGLIGCKAKQFWGSLQSQKPHEFNDAGARGLHS